jgi:hypothetical protein
VTATSRAARAYRRVESESGSPCGHVTSHHFVPLVEQYRAGLDAKLMLLHRLQAIAVDQRRATETVSVSEMQTTIERRDRVMATLAIVEHDLRNLRQQVLKHWQHLADMPAFEEIVALHREAAVLVADIVAVDEDSIQAIG